MYESVIEWYTLDLCDKEAGMIYLIRYYLGIPMIN